MAGLLIKRGIHLSGNLNNGGNATQSAANSNNQPSNSNANIGSGLSANVIK